jgi:serine/threonine protein kinase
MRGTHHTEGAPLPLPLARRVDEACAHFEAAWKTGRRSRIEDYLGDQPEPERSALLRELAALDVYYRRLAGEVPRAGDYHDRFPALDAAWLAGQVATSPAGEADQSERGSAAASNEAGTLPSPGPSPEGAAGKGPVIPGYEILGKLGQGGMGVVYKARQVRLNRVVALKVLRDGILAGPEQLARFQGEARAVARLQHPDIVQIYEVGEHEGRPYLALELVDGGSLAEKLNGTPLPPAEAARFVETLARATHHAHRQGIIHRDLKPANVLLTAGGTPKITDFGLAKDLEAEVFLSHTPSGTLLGTPSYMAPEQAWGKTGEVGPAADVYAMGAILYEALTGRPPFLASRLLEVLEQVRSQDPLPPARFRPKLPRDLGTICLKCLQKRPQGRYAGALDLAEDLRRFQAGEPIQARPTPLWERGWKWVRRRPTAAALAVVSGLASVLLVSTAFLALTLVYNEGPKVPPPGPEAPPSSETGGSPLSKKLTGQRRQQVSPPKGPVQQRQLRLQQVAPSKEQQP